MTKWLLTLAFIVLCDGQTYINTNQIEAIELNHGLAAKQFYAVVQFTSGKILAVSKEDYHNIRKHMV